MEVWHHQCCLQLLNNPITRNRDLALGLRVVANELVVSGGREGQSGGALDDGEQWPLSWGSTGEEGGPLVKFPNPPVGNLSWRTGHGAVVKDVSEGPPGRGLWGRHQGENLPHSLLALAPGSKAYTNTKVIIYHISRNIHRFDTEFSKA